MDAVNGASEAVVEPLLDPAFSVWEVVTVMVSPDRIAGVEGKMAGAE